jgi:hypothetical protein
MAAWKAKYGYDGYLFPYDPLVWDQLLEGRGAEPYYSVPFYTLHTIMQGPSPRSIPASTVRLQRVLPVAHTTG